MASRLAQAHIIGQERLRHAATTAVRSIWNDLPGYDRADVDQWLSRVIPVVLASQRQSVALTDAYLARALDRRALGVNPSELIGAAARNGTQPSEQWERPFITVWTALGKGTAYEEAVSSGLSRAMGMAAMDVQLAMRQSAAAIGEADETVFGFQRVADAGACEFCQLIDGAYVKSASAFPLHNNCGCGLEPLTSPHPRAAQLPSGVAVHDHGELGPVLAHPDHDFTSPSDI